MLAYFFFTVLCKTYITLDFSLFLSFCCSSNVTKNDQCSHILKRRPVPLGFAKRQQNWFYNPHPILQLQLIQNNNNNNNEKFKGD